LSPLTGFLGKGHQPDTNPIQTKVERIYPYTLSHYVSNKMDWIEAAKQIFKLAKPKHFTNYNHCEECAEHDQTLIQADVDTISLEELGNPGWDPICFCHDQGKKYYMPALIRLSLETIHHEGYFGQFLFHLESNGEQNSLYRRCSASQRQFIAAFVVHMIESYPDEIELNLFTDAALRVYEIWSGDR
jgi:hypothetical protein